MQNNTIIDNAKVMSKGQVTIPKDIREFLGISVGDKITFIAEGNSVRIVNAATYAMQLIQSQMSGEALKSGLDSEEKILELVKEIRSESTFE